VLEDFTEFKFEVDESKISSVITKTIELWKKVYLVNYHLFEDRNNI